MARLPSSLHSFEILVYPHLILVSECVYFTFFYGNVAVSVVKRNCCSELCTYFIRM